MEVTTINEVPLYPGRCDTLQQSTDEDLLSSISSFSATLFSKDVILYALLCRSICLVVV
jgi:hypothetical protein